MVASRWPWRLDFLAAAINRSISAVVRYSRVRTEEFTVVGADRPPLRFFTIFCPRFNTTGELSSRVMRVAVLRDSAIASGPAQFAAIQAATRGLELRPVDMRSAGEIERAITAFAGSSNGGLIVTGSAAATVSQSSTHGLEPPRAREGSGRSVLVLTTAPHQCDKKERTEPTAVANKLPSVLSTVFN